MARALMIQGTGSDVGKSLIVAGLCRMFARRGLRVAPFKPQNMSNNAAVTEDGGEIGRAQWLQALACGISPSVHMNPVLLKPESDGVSQVVVQGKRMGSAHFRDYRARGAQLSAAVRHSFESICAAAELVIVEGAGSPAEVNLREGDLANMGFAAPLGIPVVLAADIERGGVIASLVGTHALLDDADRACVRGFIINKFRGDETLFQRGIETIQTRTGWRHFGTLPYLQELKLLPKEDGYSLKPAAPRGAPIRIAVPMLPHFANSDDFDPLSAEPDVEALFIPPGRALPADADLIIIPGTKSTIADLHFLRAQGWDIDILAHARRGGRVLGICGGYQMLGRTLHDPHGLDGPAGDAEGLGLLDVSTRFEAEKHLEAWRGECTATGLAVDGYHMHMGRTQGADCARPMFRGEGAQSADGRVQGCYIHGLFGSDAWRQEFLQNLRMREDSGVSYRAEIMRALDALADCMEERLAIDTLLGLAQAPRFQALAAAG